MDRECDVIILVSKRYLKQNTAHITEDNPSRLQVRFESIKPIREASKDGQT